MRMKDAIKFGFGFAFGAFVFRLCDAAADKMLDKVLKKRFDEDLEFRLAVKKISPELYVKYRKENKETTAE